MRSARSTQAGRRRLGLFGDVLRLVAAAALLAVVAFVTVRGVNDAGKEVERGRVQDRIGLARAIAGPLDLWLRDARETARQFAAGANPSQLAGWDTLRVDTAGKFVGTSGRYTSLSGVASNDVVCPTKSGLRALVDAARQGPAALVITPPGTCEPVIAAAAPSAGGVAVVTSATDLNGFLAEAAVGQHLEPGLRMVVVDPAGTMLSLPNSVEPARAELSGFARRVAAREATLGRYEAEVAERSAEIVAAGAPLDGGWATVVEQDAAGFDVAQIVRPSGPIVVGVAVLFVLVLVMQAMADARRRATARYADAHTAAFIAVLGHELRTPLTVIKAVVDTLALRWDALSDEQRHDMVDRLPQQSRRLTRVVDRLVLAANLQSGSAAEPSRSPIAIAPVLDRIAAAFTPIAPLHRFRIHVEPETFVSADANVLDQIVDQLVDNAVKYSPAGGEVRLSATRRRGRVEVSVEDDGVGLPPNARRIFDAFVQGEDVDRRVHAEGGVGVGLYIVRALCEQLGGTVRAEPRSTGGARFVVSLPSARAPVAARV